MAYNIGPKIGIDGEAEFRKKLKEINTGLKTLSTEAKAVAEEFRGQEDSTEALGAQTDVLSRQLLTLKERLELQNRMLAESVAAYGEADERSQKWQQTVNGTTAEINKLQHQINQNNAKMGEATDATGKLTAEIDKQEKQLQELQRAYSNAVLEQGKSSGQAQELAGKIRGLSGDLEANRAKLQDAGAAFAETGESATGLSGIMGGAMPMALGAAAVGVTLLIDLAKKAATALSDMVTESAAFADEIMTLSAQTGLSTQTLQEFEYMANLVDVPVSTLQGSLTKLTRSMDNYRSGNAATVKAFEKLGLSMDTVIGPDGMLRNAEDVWYVVIDALGRVQNQTERDAIAMAIFGKSAQELNPIINQGSAGLRAFAQEAHDVNYVLSDEQVNALGAVQDEFDRFDKIMEGTRNQMAAELAPQVIELVRAFTELATSLDWEAITKGLSIILAGVTDLIRAVQFLVECWNMLTGGGSQREREGFSGLSAARLNEAETAAANLSTPNYSTLAAQEARNRSAFASERQGSGFQGAHITIGVAPGAEKYITAAVREETERQGPSLKTGR